MNSPRCSIHSTQTVLVLTMYAAKFMITSIWCAMQSLARTQCNIPSHARPVCVLNTAAASAIHSGRMSLIRVPIDMREWYERVRFLFEKREEKKHSIEVAIQLLLFTVVVHLSTYLLVPSQPSQPTQQFIVGLLSYGVHLRRERKKNNNFVCTFLYCRWWLCVCVCESGKCYTHSFTWMKRWLMFVCLYLLIQLSDEYFDFDTKNAAFSHWANVEMKQCSG